MDKLKDVLKVAALLVVCAGVPLIGWELMPRVPSGQSQTPAPTYAELVTIVLAGVTVVLAVLAIVIAILAVWGYKSIKDEAALAADRAVKSTVQDAVKAYVSDDAMEKHFAKEVRRRFDAMFANESLYAKAFEILGDNPEQGTVGTEYPKDEGTDDQRQTGG